MSGLFITLEGGDGTGKSTQIGLLQEWFESHGREVVKTLEPGGSDFGKEIREIVLHSRGHIVARSEALLYAADRAHNVATNVRPALERGAVVIQDRYIDSSVAYQGAGRVLDATEIRDLSMWATEGLVPDLTVVLDLDPVVSRERLLSENKKFDRLESQELDFHVRVRDAYVAMAEAEPNRFVVIDATLDRLEIRDLIIDRVGRLG